MELPIPSIVQITCVLKLWKRCCPWIIQHVLTFLQVHLHVWWNVGIFHMQLNMRVTSLKNWHIFRQYQWFSGYRCTVFTLDVSVAYTSYTSCVASPSCSGSPRIGLLFRSVSFIFFTFIHMPVLVVYWQVWDLLCAWPGCEEFAGSVIQYPIQFQWNIESPG